MKKKRFYVVPVLILLLVIALVGSADAILVTGTSNATTLGNALGSGITVTSVSGAGGQFGTFTNASGNLGGIGPGIVMSSGYVTSYSDGPNNSLSMSQSFGGSGQADLTALAGTTTYDAASLYFNYVASDTQVTFDFVFGSEEYAEYVGSQFNDVFGAFHGGAGGTNVSFDQFNNNITINSAWMNSGTGTELDGATVLLQTVFGGLTVGSSYNFMFGIADASDYVYDSTVFISAFGGTSGEVVGTKPPEECTVDCPPNAVPEPGTMLLLGTGLIGLAYSRRKLNK